MPRPIERLSALGVSKLAKRKGVFCDGGGLYLHSDPPAQCSWLFRYRLGGKTRWMGLGPYPAISLAKARELASNARTLKALGTDPIGHRDASRATARLAAVRTITFKQCAETYVKAHRIGWRNAAHASQWENTLNAYAHPHIGALSVQAIDTSLVMGSWNRSGLRSRRPRRGCADASRPSSTGQKSGAIVTAKTPPAGRVILTICYRPRARYGAFNTMQQCHMLNFLISWPRFENRAALAPAHLNSLF
jgi:hypothetical protein